MTFDSILKAVSESRHVRVLEIMGRCRKQYIADARHLVYYLASEGGLTQTEIADRMGRPDHTPVGHGIRSIRLRLSVDRKLEKDVEGLKISLGLIEAPGGGGVKPVMMAAVQPGVHLSSPAS